MTVVITISHCVRALTYWTIQAWRKRAKSKSSSSEIWTMELNVLIWPHEFVWASLQNLHFRSVCRLRTFAWMRRSRCFKVSKCASGSSILRWPSDGFRQGINLSCNYSLWKRSTLRKTREDLTAGTLVPNQVNVSNSISCTDGHSQLSSTSPIL